MSNKDNKNIDEQEKLLDHLIEYGGRQYIHDEVKKYEDIPELEPSKEFDERMNRMFQEAYKNEVHHERVRFGKKIAVIAVVVIGVVSAAAMNIKAVREPVLNFVFHTNNNKNKASINSKVNYDVTFNYLPNDYKQKKIDYSTQNDQITYQFYNKKLDKDLFVSIQTDQDYDAYVNQSSLSKYKKLKYKNHTYYFLSGDDNTLITYKNRCIVSIMSTENKTNLLKIGANLKLTHK